MFRFACPIIAICMGIVTLHCTFAIEPSRMPNTDRPLPAELLLENVIIDAIPNGFHAPATYLEQSRIKISPTTMLWPGSTKPIVPAGGRISVHVVDPAQLGPTVAALQAIEPDDLVQLVLGDNVLDEVAFSSIRRFRRVENLACRIRKDREVVQICDIWPELQGLTLNELPENSEFTDRGLAALAKLEKLRGLRVHSAHFSGAGFRSLAAVPSLEGIAFTGNRSVRGADISPLSTLPRLREIVLWVPSDFSDVELMKFADCKGLQHICLFGAEAVTARCADALRAAMPQCIVHVRAELGQPKYNDLKK